MSRKHYFIWICILCCLLFHCIILFYFSW